MKVAEDASYNREGGESVITRDSRNILIADDSLFFRTKLSDILVEAGHKVRFARNGHEVLEELGIDSKNTDLLILDIQMPGMDGLEVLEWMNTKGLMAEVPVLVVTSVYEPTEVLERLKGYGAAGLVTKGFPPEQLIFRVNRALYPDKVAHGARAKNSRVAVSMPVDFSNGKASHTGYILNISATGAYVHTKEALSHGDRISMKFALPGTDHVIETGGTVVRTTEEPTRSVVFAGCGVMFNGLSGPDRRRIEEFVAEEIKKQGLDR